MNSEAALIQWLRKRRRGGVTVGVYLHGQGAALACVTRSGPSAAPRVEWLGHEPTAGGEEPAAALARLAKRHRVAGAACVCVLDLDHYQLHQLGDLAVPAAELRDAVRWRVGELLDYPVADSALDAFQVPVRGAVGEPMVFAVSARREEIDRVATAARRAGLRPQAVDIPEFALRNIVAEVDEQGGGLMVVLLGERHGRIVVSQGDTLYLARALDFGSEALRGNPMLEGSLALEVQRSLDFYESQLSGMPAARVLLAPSVPASDTWADTLDGQLAVPAQPLDCERILDFAQPRDAALQGYALLALGGALRREAGGA